MTSSDAADRSAPAAPLATPHDDWRYTRILEGGCPHCGSTLERRADYGWCRSCDTGHALEVRSDGTGTYSLTIEPKTATLTTLGAGSWRVESTISRARFYRELTIGDAGAQSASQERSGRNESLELP